MNFIFCSVSTWNWNRLNWDFYNLIYSICLTFEGTKMQLFLSCISIHPWLIYMPIRLGKIAYVLLDEMLVNSNIQVSQSDWGLWLWGLWLRHSKTFRFLVFYYSTKVRMVVCISSLSCLELTPLAQSQVSYRQKHISSRIALYLAPSILPVILSSFPCFSSMGCFV